MFGMKSKLCLLVLLSSSYLFSADCIDWKKRSDLGKGFIIGGGAVVTLGGAFLLYKLISREPSNEKILGNARDVYESLCDKYGAMELLDKADGLSRCTEQDLATLSLHRDMRLMPSVAANFRSLQGEKDKLQERTLRDAHKNDKALRDMRLLLRDMKQMAVKLKHLKLFWQDHACFFDLYYHVKKLSERYEEACFDVYDSELVRRAVMASPMNSNGDYPHLRFGETLKSDIDALKRRMNSAKRYEVLSGKTDRLLQSLTGLFGTVVSLPEYNEELHLRKKHKLEQARIDAEREKARAERMKSDAMHQQAAAERDKAYAMHQQAKAERDRAEAEHRTARAIEDQTLIKMMQPAPQPSHVTVTLNSPMHPASNAAQKEYVVDPDRNDEGVETSLIKN